MVKKAFLMNLPLSAIPKTKIGCCPHGLPMGACPICNGGGAGGGGGAKKMERPAGEMSWAECFAIGQQMKAQKLAQLQKDVSLQGRANVPLTIAGRLENLAQNIAQKMSIIAEKLNSLVQNAKTNPTLLSKTIAFVANLALPVLNVIKNVAEVAQKVINNIQQKLADISDKLTAVFGELKASVEKKISDKFKDFNKKAKSLFGIFEPSDVDDEEKQVEESKRLFEMKTVFNSIKEKLFNKNELGKPGELEEVLDGNDN